MLGTVPDLLRLLVVPVFGWAAYRDVKTRRLPNRLWFPLAAFGLVFLAWDLWTRWPLAASDRLFLVRVAFSVGFVVPLSYLFWRIGGFGGADAKALMVLALIFPTYPTYVVGDLQLPFLRTTLGVFSVTILTNTVLVGLAYPIALAVRNAVVGDVAPAMFLARRTPLSTLSAEHGRLFEDRDGFTRSGLDIDALRMYLRWRGTTLAAIRADPETHRDPASVTETHDPTDGAVHVGPQTDGGVSETVSDAGVAAGERSVDGTADADGTDGADDADDATASDSTADYDDPWAAERFLDDIDSSAYGTTPETLRDGLELVATRDDLWVSPGLPFVVPMFVGFVLALTAGDLLFTLLTALVG